VTRLLISSGSPFEEAIGYSRAVVVDGWVFVSGTTGFDYATMLISDDAAEQARQAFRNIENALAQASTTLASVVRVRYIVPARPIGSRAGRSYDRCSAPSGLPPP